MFRFFLIFFVSIGAAGKCFSAASELQAENAECQKGSGGFGCWVDGDVVEAAGLIGNAGM